MKLSFRHAFQPGKLLIVPAQVKSGPSFRAASSDARTLALDIDRPTIIALSGSVSPEILVWVPPPPMDRVYWYASNPRRRLKTPVKVDREQYVRPSIRYDLTRFIVYASWAKRSARQTTRQNVHEEDVRRRARYAYANLKDADNPPNHPLVGRIAVTRLAWRHVTRLSRPKKRRILSLRVVPYLKAFLDQIPDRFVCNPERDGLYKQVGRRTVETRHVLCWYDGALSIDNQIYKLLVRIKEEISYPTDWMNRPLGVKDIRQSATLASWWCKKDKKEK